LLFSKRLDRDVTGDGKGPAPRGTTDPLSAAALRRPSGLTSEQVEKASGGFQGRHLFFWAEATVEVAL